MSLFTYLLLNIIPLYFSIAIGFAGGRLLQVDRDSISKLVVYVIVPLVFFDRGYHTDMTLPLLSLVFIVATLCGIMCFLFYHIAGLIWRDTHRNVIALMAGQGNMGYFGLPIAMLLFDEAGLAAYVIMIIGMIVYENTLGFYITARGHHTPREAIIKLLKVPTLYTYTAGVLLHHFHIPLPEFLGQFFTYVFGTYTILGMMIVGLGLASVQSLKLDMSFIGLSFIAKFLCWPAIAFLLIALDTHLFHIYGETIHKALILLSIVPLAANSVALASILRAEPEKAASAVFLSAIFGLIYVPLMVIWFIGV